MIQRFCLSVLGLFSFFAVQAQCDPCSPVPGETIDFCYTDAEMPDRCAQFTMDGATFQYENPGRKKNPILTLPAPPTAAPASATYLTQLAVNKKNKLSTDDIVFIERAMERRADWLAIKNWNEAQINQGFTITPSGLAYKVLTEGNGLQAFKGKRVSVHYTGYLLDGKKFDSSRDRGKEFQFTLGAGQVIKGWDEGVAMMKVGSRYLFRLPPDLAYGDRGFPGAIPAKSTLFFDVQLIAVP